MANSSFFLCNSQIRLFYWWLLCMLKSEYLILFLFFSYKSLLFVLMQFIYMVKATLFAQFQVHSAMPVFIFSFCISLLYLLLIWYGLPSYLFLTEAFGGFFFWVLLFLIIIHHFFFLYWGCKICWLHLCWEVWPPQWVS